MKHVLKQCLAALLSVVLLLTLLPATALAEEAGGANESETMETEFNVTNDSVNIKTDGTYTITGSSENGNTITVESGTVTITLNNVTVKNSTSCAFDIKGGNVTLILADGSENTFESGSYYAGIHVAEGASLTIQGDGKLTAVSKEVTGAGNTHNGTIGAGIGGNGEIGGPDANGNGQDTGDNAGAITIDSGTVYATSEGDGAGIGGGWTTQSGGANGQFKSITINGGTVYAKSQRNGAGIGSGCWAGHMGTITITGGEIHAETAASAGQAYDIGAGHGEQSGDDINITGGVVYTGKRGIFAYNGNVSMNNTIIFSSSGTGKVYGDVTLDSDLTIESGQTLHIPEGSSLTVSKGRTLTVEDNATLENDGVLNNQGTVTGGGTLTGRGEVIGNEITTMGYYVRVTVPAFDSVRKGDYQPEAHVITIQNKGTNSVNISSVTVDGDEFTVEPADTTSVGVQLPSGGTDGSYKISPNANLPGGNHTAIVTVTYDGGRETAAKVSFMVHPFAVGEGTSESPYQIGNLEELKKFQNYVNKGNNCTGMYFKVTADINLKGNDNDQWEPIGSGSHKFQGTFDGDGHTISGLYIINNNNNGYNQGLFGYLNEGGTVKNLTVAGTVTCHDYGAGIVGRNSGGTVENCHNKCDVNTTGTYSYCGGVVGENSSGTVTGCYNTGKIHGEYAGGITGWNSDSTVTGCYNTGEITGGGHVGGIVGSNKGTVKDCYNTGKITGEVYVGGITGENSSGTVTNCYYLDNTAETGTGSSGDSGTTKKTAAQFRFLASTLGEGWADSVEGRPVLVDNQEADINIIDDDTPYEISDKETLEAFREYINKSTDGGKDKTFKLTKSIDLGGEEWTPIGADNHEFQGTFDGGNFTVSGLSISTSTGMSVGLFGCLGESGTVKNLTVEGNVTGMSSVGGIVGQNNGGTINGCHNAAAVTSIETAGGIVGFSNGNGIVTNCYNTGAVTGTGGSNFGGIVGEVTYGSVTSCYNTAAVTGDYCVGGIIGTNSSGTVTNCYYLSGTATSGIGGEGDATEKTAEEFASGEVTYLLQTGQSSQIWGQTVGSGTPELTDNIDKAVYKVTFQSLGAEYAVMYANPSGLAELPTEPSKAGLTFAGWSTKDGGAADFTKDSTVTADTTVYAVWELALEGSGTEDAPYLIPDKAALEAFREYVNAGNGSGEFFKLTENIDLNNESWIPIGSNTTPFKGAFDGGDHTVSGLLVSIFGDYHGLFGKIENGTVKNLGVAGSVSGSYWVGGIVGFMSYGTIENCHSDVTVEGNNSVGGIAGRSEYGKIISCYNLGPVSDRGAGTIVGGIVGANYTDNVVINCYNLGTVSADPGGSSSIGGIMGAGNGSVTNCYNMGAVSGGPDSRWTGPVTGAVKGTGIGTVTNSYYLDTSCVNPGDGTLMTSAQFASGEVAHLLQDGQETPVWGQTLASDTCPVLTSDPAKAVHTVTFHPGGSENDVKYVNPTGLTELPDAPEKAGFTFAGWSTAESGPVDFESGTPVTADVTLYPIYETTPSADAALRGKVTEEGGLPVAGANVTLRQGGKDLHTAKTGGGGSYFFEDVEPGIYEVVVEKDGKTMTTVVTVTEEAGTEKDLTMPDENVSSKLEVKGEDTPAVVVDGLDGVAQDNADPDSDTTVTVTMTVEAVTDGAADNTQDLQESIDAIKYESESSGHDYLDLTVEKTVSDAGGAPSTEPLTETEQPLTVILSFDFTGKSNIVVYRYHDAAVDTLTETANADREYIELDPEDGMITLHVKNFSIYAIGYTVQTAPTSYAITPPQTDHGTLTADRRSATRGRAVTLTATPDEGCHLASLTVTDRRGKPVELTDNGDGTYTFTQPSGRVTIAAQFVPCPTLGYADLDAGAWYHDCTDYVITNALMRGVADGIFDPDGAVTRAQMVTVLWNMRGDPVVNYYMTCADVTEADWYAEAVRWAASEGIAGGYGDGNFGPDDPITREQMAVMLYRYEQKFGSGGFTGQWSYRLPFTDLEDISDWAFEAVAWCNMKGIITGKDENIFDPKGPAKRSEMAAILTRYGQTPSAQ